MGREGLLQDPPLGRHSLPLALVLHRLRPTRRHFKLREGTGVPPKGGRGVQARDRFQNSVTEGKRFRGR